MNRTTAGKRPPQRRHAADHATSASARRRSSTNGRVMLMVGTRKGAWIYEAETDRETWRVEGPLFLGHVVNHLVLDPRDHETMVMAAKTGHLGPTIFHSSNRGHTWNEATRPPAFDKAPGRAVSHTF